MARYTLDEMSVMAKERRITPSNLSDVLASLADYSMDDEDVRYVLEEITESESISEDDKRKIEAVLENYEALSQSELIDSSVIENIEVKDVVSTQDVVETKVHAQELNSQSVSQESNDTGDEGISGDTSDGTTEQNVPKEPEVLFVPVLEETEELLPDYTEEIIADTEQLTDDMEAYIIDDSFNTVFAAGADYRNKDRLMKELSDLALIKGIHIIDSNIKDHEPVKVALELTNESKPYLDHLLVELYGDEKNNLNVELVRDPLTGKEMLVMNVDEKNLSSTQIQNTGIEMLTKVSEIINTTDKDKDYEALMSPSLRAIRDEFHADEKNITQDADVEIVYSKEDGANAYHIVADSEIEAKEAAKEMGYELKENRGGGVFEIDDRNITNMDDTKLAKASENVNYNDEVKKIDKEQGISDLNINYNNENYYGDYDNAQEKDIEEFLQDSKEDYRAISRINIASHGDQRIVEMSDTNGYYQTVVIKDGANFDANVLPKIADTYSKGAEVQGSRTYDEKGSAGYFSESSENVQLIISDSNDKTIDSVEMTIANNKAQEESLSNINTNAKTYTKTLGSYPTTGQSGNTSFITLLVFSLVMILGIAVIYIVFGG